jgi:hypothetical protein
MQSKPPSPPAATTVRHPAEQPGALGRTRTWIRQRHRSAAAHLLRGLCYGIGTGTAGLASWWLQQHL